MSKPAASLYQFGPFQLDTVKRHLMRDGEALQLPPKAFDALLTLIEHNDRVVEKGELMNAIWPDSFVEEANLTQNVSILRKVLGERAGEHRYIVTIPGRGYRFVAAVRESTNNVPDWVLERDISTQLLTKGQEETSARDGAEDHQPPVKDIHEVTRQITTSQRFNATLVSRFALVAAVVVTVSYSVISRKSRGHQSIREVKSIAVLPFRSLGPEAGDPYLGLGMADTLITRLSNIKRLIVRPTSGVRKYTSENLDPLAAGREQHVDAVLDGSIHKTQGRIRVTARLINVQDGSSLWAGSFDEKYEDIFRLEDAIVERLAGTLSVELTGEEQQRLNKHYTENSAAYHAYLRGRYYWNKRTAETIRKAIGEFQQAIDRDPNYALGYVGLADCYSTLELYAGVPPSESLPNARAAADRALQLDDSLSEAHTSSAVTYQHQWRWAEAEEEHKRAISLNPNYATAHQWFAFYYLTTRQFDNALTEAKRAQELDPISPIVTDQVALIYLLKNELNSAIEQCRRNIELNPSFPGTHYLLGSAYLKQQSYKQATTEFQKAVDLSGRASVWLSSLGYCYSVTKRRDEAFWILKELKRRYARREARGQDVAKVYAGLGKKTQAFAWLEKDFEQRGGRFPLIMTDYSYQDLRSDSRYTDLVRRMGLQP
jgi:DNA-binding winged helix-turn-helix (wHTH) protein/TolB-like protein/Flp pilus assembly protein TadD